MRANPKAIDAWLVLVVDDELANREVLDGNLELL